MARPPSADLAADVTTGPATSTARLAWLDLGLICLATSVAAFFRLHQIDAIPPGLHHDEAFEGLVARQLLETGQLKIFFEGNFGLEPLSVYLLAGLYLIFGVSATTIRLMPALAGILTVPALYLLVRELLPTGPWRMPHKALGISGEQLSRVLAVLSALALATLYWHITFSRYGVESNLVPLFEVLTFYFLFRGLRTHRMRAFLISGILLGLSLYTYQAARMLPLLLALFFLYCLILERKHFVEANWKGVVLLAVMSIITFAPLGYYFFNHSEALTLRARQVNVFNSRHSTTEFVTDNAGKALTMFLIKGDVDPRSNLPGRPALDSIIAVPFLVGAALVLQRLGSKEYGFLFIWFIVTLIPTVLSENAPHFRRALAVTPVLAIVVAVGLCGALTICYWLANRSSNWVGRAMRLVAILGVTASIAASAFITYRDYFLVWGRSSDLFSAFDVGILELVRYANGLPPDTAVYLSPVPLSHPTIKFSARKGRQMRSFDGRRGLVIPAKPDSDTMYIVVTDEDSRSLTLLQRYFPFGKTIQEGKTWDGRPYFTFFFVPANSRSRTVPPYPLEANLANRVVFLGYNVPKFSYRPAEIIPLTLYWQVLANMKESYTVFTHLLGPWDDKNRTFIWGQHDSLPLGGAYTTNQWVKGDIIFDEYAIPIRKDAPSGEYEIEIGMYLLRTMERLPVVHQTTGEKIDDRVALGTVQVESP